MKTYIQAGVLGCALSVILGAFGAHALSNILTATDLQTFHTATRYFFFHSLGLILIGLLSFHFKSISSLPSLFIFTGIILFSGSLYMYLLLKIKFLVFLTPIGGISFIVGWMFLFFQLLKAGKDG